MSVLRAINKEESRRSSLEFFSASRGLPRDTSTTLWDDYNFLASAFADRKITNPDERQPFLEFERSLHECTLSGVASEPPERPVEPETTATDLNMADAMDGLITSFNETVRSRLVEVSQNPIHSLESKLESLNDEKRVTLDAVSKKIVPLILNKLEFEVMQKTPQEFADYHRQRRNNEWAEEPQKKIEWWREKLTELMSIDE